MISSSVNQQVGLKAKGSLTLLVYTSLTKLIHSSETGVVSISDSKVWEKTFQFVMIQKHSMSNSNTDMYKFIHTSNQMRFVSLVSHS